MKPPAIPPDHRAILRKMMSSEKKMEAFHAIIGDNSAASYDHWEKIRFRPPMPPLSAAEMWAAIKFSRRSAGISLPFRDVKNRRFYYAQTGDFSRTLHEIDSNARGLIGVPGAAATSENRDLYLQKSLIEEPFSSSLLEGAATTREIARKMIEEGRQPKTVDERMVLNNYQAMSFIREHSDEPLTPERILEVHRILTDGTLERPEMVGILRNPDDDVRVVESITGETLHKPPPAEELPARLKELCEFANDGLSSKGHFLHPVIRAIILHFMLAYDHPFWDGNGRCARALFYWCVLRHKYWLLEYVSISAVIRQAAVQYGMAFLYSETDEGDLTYFIEHQLKVIERSISDLQRYLITKAKELNDLGRALGNLERQLNRRQLALLQHALKRTSARYAIAEHGKTHSVSYLTARQDLESLANRGLLIKKKEGVKSVFSIPSNLKDRLKRRMKT